MSDPAVKAAERAAKADPGWPKKVIAEEAAREALKAIREIHKRLYGFKLPKTAESRAELFCVECQVVWPCKTAKAAYSSEEL